MVATGDDFEALLVVAADAIDDPVVCGDPARPPAGEVTAQWLGLADAGERIAADVMDQCINPAPDIAVAALPV